MRSETHCMIGEVSGTCAQTIKTIVIHPIERILIDLKTINKKI
jgi:hypothetical protein